MFARPWFPGRIDHHLLVNFAQHRFVVARALHAADFIDSIDPKQTPD
jgi:hypothetical protein